MGGNWNETRIEYTCSMIKVWMRWDREDGRMNLYLFSYDIAVKLEPSIITTCATLARGKWNGCFCLNENWHLLLKFCRTVLSITLC